MAIQKKCFVIMPFGKRDTEEHRRNKKIYNLMIRPVVEACGYKSIRSDELHHPGNFTKDIIELLHKADLVVADLSRRNANVFYELGVRHTLFRSGTIPIIRENEEPPFDLFNYLVIFYSSELDGPEQFKKEFTERIKAFERLQKDRSDNPVYGVLGFSLQLQDLRNYVTRKSFEERELKIDTLNKELDELHQQNDDLIFRQKSTQEEIKKIEDSKTIYLEMISKLEKELDQTYHFYEQQNQRRPLLSKSLPFPNMPAILSEEYVKSMLKKYDFFDVYKNKAGQGFSHQYKAKTIRSDKIVIDEASGL